jgi:hypothetical protein
MGGKNVPRQGQKAATIEPIGMTPGSTASSNIAVPVADHD